MSHRKVGYCCRHLLQREWKIRARMNHAREASLRRRSDLFDGRIATAMHDRTRSASSLGWIMYITVSNQGSRYFWQFWHDDVGVCGHFADRSPRQCSTLTHPHHDGVLALGQRQRSASVNLVKSSSGRLSIAYLWRWFGRKCVQEATFQDFPCRRSFVCCLLPAPLLDRWSCSRAYVFSLDTLQFVTCGGTNIACLIFQESRQREALIASRDLILVRALEKRCSHKLNLQQ